MNQIELVFTHIHSWVWGIPLLSLLLGTGIYLTFILKGFQLRYLGQAFKEVFSPEIANSKGDISHYEALMTSLAGAIGTGTIVGVATAVTLGGMGALFWMWVMAFLGMATKYAESMLAVKFRKKDKRDEMLGGPMQYMEQGLGWKKTAIVFSILGCIAAIGTGNLVQVNAIVEGVNEVWSVDPLVTGVILAIFTGMSILGGVKNIAYVSSILVPFMALFYILGGLVVIGFHINELPQALEVIFTSAFKGQAAFGGFAGASVMTAIQLGVARSIFSNEAGLGIPTIAAAAARTDSPVRQAMITMTGALLSTVVVCTITGLVLAVTHVVGGYDASGEPLRGVAMTIAAFNSTLPGGSYIVSVGIILFAFSTIIAWAYYGEKCFEYIFGEKVVIIYRIIFTLLVIPGAIMNVAIVWLVADIANGLMVIPNLIAIIGLSSVVVKETSHFIAVQAKKKVEPSTSI